jgi:phosphatidylinositol alpha-1,6-mannosyltransferase
MRGHPTNVEIIGLFPSLSAQFIGGIQSSGRDAWKAIVHRAGEERAQLLSYETGASKAQAIFTALRTQNTAATVFVWHIQLLKLLLFLGKRKSRVVLVLHGVESWFKQDPVTRYLLRKVDLILADSDHTWRKFVGHNPAVHGMPHRTVHLGIGSPGASGTEPSDPPAVLMLGRLAKNEDYKGHRQMIEAWPAILRRKPDAQLWIVGDGDLRLTLEDLSRQRVGNGSIKFYGHVSDSEKEELLGRSRCLALPSRGEGFGLVYLEAMRLGRPCLVSTLDSGQEVVNPPEAGLAVDPSEPREMADAVQRLLTPGTEWERWSSHARSRYETNFTREHFQQRLLSVLFDGQAQTNERP